MEHCQNIFFSFQIHHHEFSTLPLLHHAHPVVPKLCAWGPSVGHNQIFGGLWKWQGRLGCVRQEPAINCLTNQQYTELNKLLHWNGAGKHGCPITIMVTEVWAPGKVNLSFQVGLNSKKFGNYWYGQFWNCPQIPLKCRMVLRWASFGNSWHRPFCHHPNIQMQLSK